MNVFKSLRASINPQEVQKILPVQKLKELLWAQNELIDKFKHQDPHVTKYAMIRLVLDQARLKL